MASASERRSGGGSWDEAGGEYRRGVAALFAAHSLNSLPFPGLPFGGANAVVHTVALETDDPIDDVVVGFPARKLFVQAKRTLEFGRPMREVAEQWLRSIRDADFDVEHDYMAAAGGSASGPVQALRRALDRLRADAFALGAEEQEALEKFRNVMRDVGATDDEIDAIIARAVILRLEVEEPDEPDAARGTLLLDGHVVEKGQGHSAWKALIAISGRAARSRVGHGVGAWLEELRNHQELRLTADAGLSRAAALEATRRAVKRYRARLAERGRRIDLTVLGAAVSPIAVSEMDAEVSVADPAGDERSSLDLLWAFRRRGRVTLTGLPGGGKSVAMASAAARWAERADWPLPIAISLRPLADRAMFRTRPLRERLLDIAVQDLSASDRPLVRDALDEALESGNAVLFLDGLDEAADRSLELTRDIAALLEEIHPDTDVVLATRDVAYTDARKLLGFAELRLNRPERTSRAVRAVLTAVAPPDGNGETEPWVALRLEWVERVLRSDRQIGETPLLPVLLALIAANSASDDLPHTRAAILSQVVHDVVRRYEVRRDLALSPLPEGHEADALWGAFPVIASGLAASGGTAPQSELAKLVAEFLASDWGLPPAPAEATARQILTFWDESGVFVASGQRRLTSPRLQLLLEIGAALDAAQAPGDAAQFVASAAPRTEMRETLILAAGLSPPIADAFAAYAARDNDDGLAVAVAVAVRQGARLGDQQLRALVRRLIRATVPSDDEAWVAAKVLVELPVPRDLQEDVLSALSVFPDQYRAIAEALAVLSWEWEGERRADALERGLRVDDLPRLQRRKPKEGNEVDWRDVSVDQGHMRVKERAAAELLPTRPELAPVVIVALEHVSIGTHSVIMQTLRETGHGELASAAFAKSMQLGTRLAPALEAAATHLERTLEAIAALAEPAPLAAVEARRLAELASFLETIEFNDSQPWRSGTWRDEARGAWYQLIATLGGFDLAKLAAEAELVRQEITVDDHKSLFSLLDLHAPADLEHWNRVADSGHAEELAIRMLAADFATAAVAARALAAHPNGPRLAARVDARLHQVPGDSKRPALWAYLQLVDDQATAAEALSQSADAGIREALASLWGLEEEGRPTEVGTRLALDPERRVQLAALVNFERVASPRSELIALVERVAASEPQPFTCYHCGTENAADADFCVSCRFGTARPPDKAQQLLDAFAGGGSA